ncbi:hypothetical protein [Nocardia tengchongensis]|uniref:hypothetical protein n=1 Tax=Nocardia tengchongensis TaxID=2055889 RepID=UPI00368C4F35
MDSSRIEDREHFDLWTRRPVVWLPVVHRDVLIGYLWAGLGSDAAGYLPGHVIEMADSIDFWQERLAACRRRGRTGEQAIRSWIGTAEHPRFGAVPRTAQVRSAPSVQELSHRLNPELPLLGPGPWIQDSRFPDATPLDRASGWTPLVGSARPTYAVSTSTPVWYLPIAKGRNIIGYLWASPSEPAARFLPAAAGERDALLARGVWALRLQTAFSAGYTALQALHYCRSCAQDPLAGWIPPEAGEQIAVSLAALATVAAGDAG